MTLFFCKWEDRASLLVDDESRERAAEIATDVAGGVPPATIRQLPPRFFVAEIFFESEADDDDDDAPTPDPDGEEELVVQPLDYVDDELAKLHDADLPAVLVQAPAAAVVEGEGVCVSEAEDDAGAVVRCSRKSGHEPPHRAGDLVWE